MNLVRYFQDTWAELKLVRWPTRAETVRMTVLVIGISVAVGAYVGGLDFLFTNLLTQIVK
jgi:preprotein translocase SecE subunit